MPTAAVFHHTEEYDSRGFPCFATSTYGSFGMTGGIGFCFNRLTCTSGIVSNK
jgi:hypothetical protein